MILTTNMLLKKLIKNLPKEKKNIRVTGLALHSKKVKKGFIFFAIKGNKLNGEQFINDAVNRGAKVIVCSKNCQYENNKVLIIKKYNTRQFLSEISSKFFRLKPKNIIAVTGTNGKTSVADLFYQILSLNKIPVATIGTLGTKINRKKFRSDLTSPDTISLHQTLEKIKKHKVDNVIIETSSHGLHQQRVNNLNFKAGIFTNFSQDHLDYHKTMQSYLNSKLLLFKNLLNKKKIVISDKLNKEFSILKKISIKRKLRLVDISSIKKKLSNYKNLTLNDFQSKNLSMAIAAAKLCNLKENKIFNSLKKIKDVEGRLELVRVFPNNIKVYVDFAHTPDALLKSIQALKSTQGENISLVFGCGGDRDHKKRPLMAKIASSNCKKIYITDDNPRNENPKRIRSQLINNIKNKNRYNIGNRSKAIKEAISKATPDEVILVSGKGHEEKQIYKNKTFLISDKKIITKLNVKIKKLSHKAINFNQNKEILKEIKKNIIIGNFHGLSIDSRTIKKDNLFLTIRGKNNDGSKFIPEVLKKGIKFIISSKKINKFKKKVIKVDDEIKLLNYFAHRKRDLSNAKIFAITGSAGKTSLKNLITDLLNNFGATFSSPKSFNNHLGVPLSLSQLKTEHKYGVFEVGMSKQGEINKLSKLIRPHIGVITNIGEAHIENFKNLKGIANAKGELISNIKKNGTIILNRDDKYFNNLKKKAKLKELKIVSFGMSKKSNVFPISVKKIKNKIRLIVKIYDQILKFNIKNLNIYNVLASLAVLKEINLDLNQVINLFMKYEPTEGRGKIYKIKRYNKKFKLIDESYNANPLSVKIAINNFNFIKKQKSKKYLLLGDMLELGDKSETLHKNLSKVINNSDIDKVFIKGSKALATYININKKKRGNIFQLEDDVDIILNDIIANNDYLMIKGSNATGLNRLTKKMIKGY